MPFVADEIHGEVVAAHADERLLEEASRLIDPAAAIETVHWGRNYLYSARFNSPQGALEVVVKQFRNQGLRRRLERRLRGSKATRSWQVAKQLVQAGIATPEPLFLVESNQPDGPSFYISRRLETAFEVRHFFRRLQGSPDAGEFPDIAADEVLRSLGRLARRLHDAGIWYRDLSMGNVLLQPAADGSHELFVVDFNRARTGRRLGVYRRCRDICRFPIVEEEHRVLFLEGYWGKTPSRISPRWWLFAVSVRAYLSKHAVKNRLRGSGHRKRVDKGGTHHAHIPAASDGAAARDKVVWDHLSDQPHQHAGKLEKLAIRLADAPSHLRDYAIVCASTPRVWRRYRRLRRDLYSKPVRFSGLGVCLRPWPQDPEALLAAVADLGVSSVLLRLHPWQNDHDDEEELARNLVQQGVEVAFALPQNRDLVRDPKRWCLAVESLAERFSPYGRHFQVGQAPNRSKWGVWTRSEYLDLYLQASQILRRHQGVRVMGPAVIDFELQVTMALVNRRLRGLRFDVVSSLLYVDRRGAPENRQLGFDTVDKAVLLRAIAETGRCSNEECWITEVNWPLWEGPHSPAGRKVSVDEQAQADYLVRYYLLVLATGLVDKVFWWQLIARGYGLIASDSEGRLRRRPSFEALATLAAQLDGAICLGRMAAPEGVLLYRFERTSDEVIVAWGVNGPARVELPQRPVAVVGRDGDLLPLPDGTTVEVSGSPCYLRMA